MGKIDHVALIPLWKDKHYMDVSNWYKLNPAFRYKVPCFPMKLGMMAFEAGDLNIKKIEALKLWWDYPYVEFTHEYEKIAGMNL